MKIKIIKKRAEIPIGFLVALSFFLFSIFYIFSYKYLPKEVRSCKFKKIFKVPCPSCGGTRAGIDLIKGKIVGSFIENPLIFFVSIFLFFWSIISIYSYLKGYHLKLILSKAEIVFLRIFLISFFFLNWIYLILKEVL